MPDVRTGFDHAASSRDAGAMTGNARQMPPLGPTAIAIHDDGDVARQAPRVELFEQAHLVSLRGLENLGGFHEMNQGRNPADCAGASLHRKANIAVRGVQRGSGQIPGTAPSLPGNNVA